MPTLFETTGTQGVSLNSWHFLLIAFVAIACCRLVPSVPLRQACLLSLNAYFLSFFLPGPSAAIVLGVFLVATYGVAKLKLWYGQSWPAAMTVAFVVAFWAFLFLIKDPQLLVAVNPFSHFPLYLVGISYIVFRAVSYVIDVETFQNRSVINFLNYMLFFPTLLAGPIERYDRFERNERESLPSDAGTVLAALHRIANGFIKKFVIADNLAALGIFSQPTDAAMALPLVWLGVLLQLALIYLDFSGYCDIVIGVAALMGIRIAENFNRPYLATNVQEFWNRWHMTLTLFIRDYVFMPLSKSVVRTIRPCWQLYVLSVIYLITMMLIALWHGTTMGFFIFGLIHGIALVWIQVQRKWRQDEAWRAFKQHRVVSALLPQFKMALTYTFFAISMVLWYFDPSHSFKIILSLIGVRP